MSKPIVVIGGGPAGVSAALRLAENGKKVVLFEKEAELGGLCKTVKFDGFRFDIGGHRFFTKSNEVNELWEKTLKEDFLVRPRLSRMYYKNKFFDYPIKPINALSNLGVFESILIFSSYVNSRLFPYKTEKNFEQWISNRFGKRLFNHFFKSYTEKLWGLPCDKIQAEWAAQRIKGLSFTSAVKNALFSKKDGIKTLIREFKYPKYGPGMMYEKMASNFVKKSGKVFLNSEIVKLTHKNDKISSITIKNNKKSKKINPDYVVSTMPITELVSSLEPGAPRKVIRASEKLSYRSFLTVSLILNSKEPFPDTWIYVHSPEVKLGRVQNFKKWSPYMVPEGDKIGIGAEYFCTEGDELWNCPDDKLIELALDELEKINLTKKKDFVSGFVRRAANAYPVYSPGYLQNLKTIKEYLSGFKNLQSVGRAGMFRYNNMDHSILTGLYSAENILGKNYNLDEINADKDYHEYVENDTK